jgi:lipid-A-disaccharide synthase-like uncharacterized protein
MDKMFLSFGLVGSIVSISGSFPMLFHLIKVKDSTGQSVIAWSIWMISNFLLLAYALYIKEPVFVLLQFLWVIMTSLTIFFIYKYRKVKVANEITA